MSSVIGDPSTKVGFDNQTLPESADDHRATQLHHVQGRHRKISPKTANHRADEATAFLAWAADRGLRPAFEVKYKVVKRPTGTKMPGLAAALVRSRQGRRPESDSEDVKKVSFLPKPEQIPVWLDAVRKKKGYPKYLASRFVIEAGTRLFETVALDEHQIPSKGTLEELAAAGQTSAPVTLVVTKGDKPRTISITIAFLIEIREWLDGRWLTLRYLWHKRTKRLQSSRVFLSEAATSRAHQSPRLGCMTASVL